MKKHGSGGMAGGSKSSQHRWIVGGCALVIAAALSLSGPASGARGADKPASDPTSPREGEPKPGTGKTKLAESGEARLGVKIRALRLSAAGYMLDLRYRVIDADKAAPLLDRKVRPYLLAQDGARFGVPVSPKVGQLRSTRHGAVRLDRDYSMLFGNPGRYLQQGSKITLVLGEQKIEGLIVE